MSESEVGRKPKKRPKELTPGIIYLSRIPPNMGVTHIRHILSVYGEMGKIFLQPEAQDQQSKKRRIQFTEGWVEFLDKKIAKGVAATLNGSQIGGKRKSRWYDELWTMKYLPKFRWTHLNERLEYERMIRRQKIQTEVRQARKEVDFYKSNVERSKAEARFRSRQAKKARLREKYAGEFEGTAATTGSAVDSAQPSAREGVARHVTGVCGADPGETRQVPVGAGEGGVDDGDDRKWTFQQTQTEEQFANRKRKLKTARPGKKILRTDGIKKAADNKAFLKTLFSGGVREDDSGS